MTEFERQGLHGKQRVFRQRDKAGQLHEIVVEASPWGPNFDEARQKLEASVALANSRLGETQ